MNRHFNNHGVSQVIAALLLIAIAVAAAILLYVFAIGLLGSLGTGGGQQTKEQLIMEAYNWDTTGGPPGSLTLTVRDVGPSSIDAGHADIFVNGVPQAATGCSVLSPGDSCVIGPFTVSTTGGTTITSGAAYPLKIVTPTGGVFSYSIIAGGSS
jgi:FlaG/FlaF family flagellin (archaellin)